MKHTGLLMTALCSAAMLCGAQSLTAASSNDPAALAMIQKAQYPNMARVLAKLQSGERLKVAYFGGSITYGATATDQYKASWRALLTRYLEDAYPNSRIRPIDAAIGGKGSYLAVFREDRDVIAYSPDLTFVEFSVNDSPANIETYESILRKLHKSNPNMAIFMVISGQDPDNFRSDCEKQHKQLADYYGIPYVAMPGIINGMVKEGKIKSIRSILSDYVHPNDEGYKIYAKNIEEGLEKALSAEGKAKEWPEKPLFSSFYDTATMQPLADFVKGNSGWTVHGASRNGAWFDSQPSRWLDTEVSPDKDSAEFNFTLDCKAIGFYYEIFNGGGSFDVIVDGKKVGTINTAFGESNPSLGSQYFKLDKPGEHKITLKTKGKLAIGNVMFAK